MGLKRSFLVRNNPIFLRNEFDSDGKYGFPLIKKQSLDLSTELNMISFSDTKSNDKEINKSKGVHFFIDDYRFEGIYNHPERTLDKLSQYKFLCTPDFSLYYEMKPWRQIEGTGKNRWIGAYWQSKGYIVYPTVSWSYSSSYDYCFDGIEKGSVVVIGMIGAKRNNKRNFLLGYKEMLRRIEPEYIICFGKPFDEMEGNLIVIDYNDSRKVVR
jgi:hypothetical protein